MYGQQQSKSKNCVGHVALKDLSAWYASLGFNENNSGSS